MTAETLGIPVLQPERLDETVELPADTIVTCAYGAIVPTSLLARHLWLNVHPSLLPRWRGAAPVERALMAGDTTTGVTIIKLTEELDGGPIAAQQAFPIEPDDDAGAVYRRSAEVAVGLLDDVLEEPSSATSPRRARRTRRSSHPPTASSTSTPSRRRACAASARSRRTSAPVPSSTAAA